MTVNEALLKTQTKGAGLINKASVKYAQSLLLPGEEAEAAAIANIYTHRDKYPGIVVITNQRVIAACGIPGIKRSTCLAIEDLENCEETSMIMQYKVTFRTRKESFAMSVDPDVGANLSPHVAKINGEDLASLKLDARGNILNTEIFKQQRLNQKRKEQAKERADQRDIELQKKASMAFESEDSDDIM